MPKNINIKLFNITSNLTKRINFRKISAPAINLKKTLTHGLDTIIEFQNNTFLHVGLKTLSNQFNGTFEELALELINGIPERTGMGLFVPAYTPSFRDTCFISQKYSMPAFGYFNRLSLMKSAFRTVDPIHSMSVSGNVPKWCTNRPTYFDTFGETGHFAKLIDSNCTLLNIGTNELISTFFHVVECRTRAPYKCFTRDQLTGSILLDDGQIMNITVKNHAYMLSTKFNRRKIERYLFKEGVLKVTNMDTVKVFQCQTSDLVEALTRKLKTDPTFMVTF